MKQYALDYTPLLCLFLERRNIDFFVSDADIIGINLQAHNDTFFAGIILEYANFLIESRNDTSIYPDANGSLYHI